LQTLLHYNGFYVLHVASTGKTLFVCTILVLFTCSNNCKLSQSVLFNRPSFPELIQVRLGLPKANLWDFCPFWSSFYRLHALYVAQQAVSKHWREGKTAS